MAVGSDTMWVGDGGQLDATVQTLVAQGGELRHRGADGAVVFVPKRLNVPVLVGGLVLCLVPGLAYLAWHLAVERDREVSVRVGPPANLQRDPSPLWADDPVPPTPPPDREPTVFGRTPPPAPGAEPPAYPVQPAEPGAPGAPGAPDGPPPAGF